MKYLITFLLIISVSFASRYYALLDMSGTVQQVIVATPDVIATLPNAPFYVETTMDGSLHGPYAGIGYTFNQSAQVFVSPKPFSSWILNTTTHQWESPVPMPTDAVFPNYYYWNESTQTWVLINGNLQSVNTNNNSK